MEILEAILFCIAVCFLANWKGKSRIAGKTAEEYLAEIKENADKYAQEMEDGWYFVHYEMIRLNKIRQTISDDWLRTQQAIRDNPHLKECVSKEALEEITDEYETYLKLCKAIDWIGPLSKQEFIVKKKNPLLCTSISFIYTPLDPYTIHHPSSAKYSGDKGRKLLDKEFDEKYGLA